MRVIESGIIEVPIEFKAVIKLLQAAILKKNLVKFYYESRNGNKGFRIIPPYMIIPRKEILFCLSITSMVLEKIALNA